MVMHARKHPRLNDGYYERNQAHPYENMERYPSKSGFERDRYSDRSSNSPSYKRYRNESPGNRDSPRFASKVAHTDRSNFTSKPGHTDRPKSQYERGSGHPTERKPNHNSSSNSANDRDHHSNHDREHRDSKETKKEAKDHKTEVQKSALRVSGDWSEHTSSSGKRYFYNCKTEVSQWERPKDWVDVPKPGESKDSKDSRSSNRSSSTQSSSSSFNKVSDSRHKQHSNSTANSTNSGNDRYQDSRNYKPSPSSYSHSTSRYPNEKQYSPYEKYKSQPQRNSSQEYSHSQYSSNTFRDPGYRRDLDYRKNTPPYSRDREQVLDSNGSRSSTPQSTSKLVEHVRNENEDSRQMEDMDISPGSTPTEAEPPTSTSRPQSRTGAPVGIGGINLSSGNVGKPSPSTSSSSATVTTTGIGPLRANAIRELTSQLGEKTLQNMDSQKLTVQAIQTLQKLHQALLNRQAMVHNTTAQSPRSTCTEVFPSSQSPHVNNSSQRKPAQTEEDKGRDSPARSEHSIKSYGQDSPTPSHSSSQGVAVSNSLPQAVKPSPVHLTPSLGNYYNDNLTEHVRGWQADHANRQANRYMEDAHNIGSHFCTKVSAELKRARSLVRVAEIQATTQEQRILFLKQQISDLESGKTHSTYSTPALAPPAQPE